MGLAVRLISISIIIIFSTNSAYSGGVKGTIGLVLRSGDIKYGAKVTVYLTTKETLVRSIGGAKQYSSEAEYKLALLDAHYNAYKIVETSMNDPNYIKQTTKTNFDGKFIFKDVSPGQYFVVVTFPTTIAMNKVFWQVPVVMERDEIVEIELSNDNLSLPAFFDR